MDEACRSQFSGRVTHALSHKSEASWRTGGGTRTHCSLLLSAKRLRAYGRKINHQTYYTTKSLPNLTAFSTSNYSKNATR